MGKFKILNAFQIKLLMAFLMLLDHLRYIHGLVSPETAEIHFPVRGAHVRVSGCGGNPAYP